LASIKQILFVILLLNGLLFLPTVYAEDENQTVKDVYEDPESSTEPAAEDSKTVDTNENVESSTSTELTFSDFLRMVMATIFVAVLLYIMLRFVNKKNRAYQKANYIENLGGTSLGSNRSVQLIKIGNRLLVVGVGENIQLLKEIDDVREYEELLQKHNEKMDFMMQPADFFSKMKNKFIHQEVPSDAFSSHLKRQIEEVSKSRKKAMTELEKKGRDVE
jgi:flagellar protein FliO/FliZ